MPRVDLPRALVALAAAGVLVAAGGSWAAERRARDEVLRRAAAAPLGPEALEVVAEGLRRGDDPTTARLAVARGIVGQELAAAGDDPLADRLERLELARELSAEALAERPASWEAALLHGASTLLAGLAAEDPRVVTESPAWDRPLSLARRLAPVYDEPVRLQAVAYLELWTALSPEKRELALSLLERAFRDQRTFGRLIGPWLAIAEDAEAAMAPLPDLPFVWDRMARALAERGDGRAAVEARERWRRATAADLERRLAEATAARDEADPFATRSALLALVAGAPRDRGSVPLVTRALGATPAGPAPPSLRQPLAAWLEWALDLELIGRGVLDAAALDRLAGVIQELPPPLAARVSLATGRLAEAEAIERSRGRIATEPWSAYWLAKARHLAARGDAGGARAALDRTAPTWRAHPVLLEARRALAADDARPPAAAGSPAPALDGGWFLRSAGAVTGVEVALASTGLVEVLLDGTSLGVAQARPGRTLRRPAEAPAGLHLLEVRPAGVGTPAVEELALVEQRSRRGGA